MERVDGDEIKIKSKNNGIFTISVSAAKMNNTIVDVLVDTPAGGIIPVNIESDILKHIIEYCNHYNGNPPDKDTYRVDGLNDWEKEFVNSMSHKDFLHLINAADFMQNDALKNCCFRGLSDKTRGQTKEKIREICGVDANVIITAEDEKKVRDEFKS